ncbi:hypothetical protein [Pseudomonas rubra]|uniref:HTH-like domain-containing protein n=1 Tax=Pseudomonas rubra TaxID=2942627 RepID=A0ABT5PF46_9PSED|nr:hypothetical protein [Pseudomonas rubra]MDD1016950.1 hypothetical protein [Pseudomonas rubra]MDD1041053.1 hypothetical protein [Pseudomonas rubra]MDD1157480.1 hypothetical protein [Pseudomonas rubra]
MNSKLNGHHEEILSLRIQSYTLGMIQRWLSEQRQVNVCISAISRSIRRSLNTQRQHSLSVSGSDFDRYRSDVDASLQRRTYRRHLNKYIGLIENYRYVKGFGAEQILIELRAKGVKTSLSSIVRMLQVINEQKNKEFRC